MGTSIVLIVAFFYKISIVMKDEYANLILWLLSYSTIMYEISKYEQVKRQNINQNDILIRFCLLPLNSTTVDSL